MGKRYKIKGKKAWVEKDKKGRFKNWMSFKRSIPIDRKKKSKTKVKPGYGHKGDQGFDIRDLL